MVVVPLSSEMKCLLGLTWLSACWMPECLVHVMHDTPANNWAWMHSSPSKSCPSSHTGSCNKSMCTLSKTPWLCKLWREKWERSAVCGACMDWWRCSALCRQYLSAIFLSMLFRDLRLRMRPRLLALSAHRHHRQPEDHQGRSNTQARLGSLATTFRWSSKHTSLVQVLSIPVSSTRKIRTGRTSSTTTMATSRRMSWRRTSHQHSRTWMSFMAWSNYVAQVKHK